MGIKAKSISQLNMLSEEEYSGVVSSFNNTNVDYPRDKCVHTLFEEQAEKTPEKMAVIACDKTLTYGELNEQANRIAHSLIAKGVKPNDIIAFILPRKSYLLSVMFGILKSGAAYMPIDPDYPQDRIDYMLKDSGAKFCITEDNIGELLDNKNASNPVVEMRSDNLCYCIYTSGSTGQPKGTAIAHKNLVNFCASTKENNYQNDVTTNGNVCISLFKTCFDAFGVDTILMFLNGKTLVLTNEDEMINAKSISMLCERHNVDVFQTTPNVMSSLLNDERFCKVLKNAKIILLAAEVFRPDILSNIRKYASYNIYNGYGPSETTIGVSFGEIDRDNFYFQEHGMLLCDIEVLSKTELKTVIKNFNNTAVDYPRDKCVHTLFEEQAEKTTEKTAVIACDKTLTYGELNEQANRIAHSLIVKGVKPNDIIAFMLPRKSYLLSAMFGILKSGAAYMPIDPDYPQDRIDYMLADSGTKYCITEDNIGELLSNEYASNPGIEMSSDDYYCALHTSGSTGKPKLSVLKHCNLQNFIRGNKQFFENVEISVSATIVTFDAFILDTVIPLCKGIPLMLLCNDEIYNQALFEEAFSNVQNAMFFSTPTKLKHYITESKKGFAEHISSFVVGGELFNEELYILIRQHNEIANIFNIYGPTEDTICISFDKIDEVVVSKKFTLNLSQIDILSRKEIKTVTKDFNNTAVDYPRDKYVHTLFEEQVTKTPDKVAVIACDRTLTYNELNKQANRIAHSLIAKGVKPNDIIAFMLPRKSYLLSVMFGILKSGAAYMPIDPDYPQDRIDYMLQDSGAKYCITEENIGELLSNENTGNPCVEMSSDNLCYCIYTSGSTGKPKGTLLNHENVVNYCDNNNNNLVHSIIKETYQGIVSVTTVGFDIFVTESILPLLNGIIIVLANEHQAKIQKELNELLKEHPVDILQTTPTKMKSLIADSSSLDYLRQLKVIILGGEALDKTLTEQLPQLTDAKMFNIYGPTETTVWVTNAEIK